ncbi:MAG: 3-oxoacyl-ACP reductase [Sorangiineae bacterium]|nr:3-oxoacyl-ACP reductase [Polyangiaceae bacterium]MEB2323679.1 3-oxoacyl-ACP reductase [Sorangiineae bacterium]
MNDWLVDLGKNPRARSLVKSLGLPIPLPAQLQREHGTWAPRPLMDRAVALGAAPGAALLTSVAGAVARAGGDPFVEGDASAFRGAGDAYGRPARGLDQAPERLHALVFDASGVTDAAGLRALYDFFHPLIRRIGRSGRLLVLGRPEDPMIAGALTGFVKSAAKEIGGAGATANVILVARGAEALAGGPLEFFLSARSAFVTAQPVEVSLAAAGEPALRAKATNGDGAARALDRKVAIVTGAARGIGAATARLLAAQGARVICVDRPEDVGETSTLARELDGVPLGLDVIAPDAGERLVEAARAEGGADIVVQNAGITRDKTLGRMKEELWDLVLGVNLAAVVKLNAALAERALSDGGRIVCLSSIAGLAGNNGQTNYAASKAGVAGHVRGLAPKLAERGITVNAIAPGFIETRLTAVVPLAVREGGRRLSALGQGGIPEDVAQAIAFLSSPAAQGLTGQVLRVCGGAFIGA